MLQDIYLALVECDKCGRRFPMVYEYPSMNVYPFGGYCDCEGSRFNIVSNTALAPQQWFDYMKIKRGEKV